MNILDPRFKYTSAISTDVLGTWKKFGFTPTTETERIARQRKRNAECATSSQHGCDAQFSDFSFRRCERASGAH
jgi:hypothetical protein